MNKLLFLLFVLPEVCYGQLGATAKDVEDLMNQQIHPNENRYKSSLEQIRELKEEERRERMYQRPVIKYELPEEICVSNKYFDMAFDSLEVMRSKQNFDLSKAVFIVENAYSENKLSWTKFNSILNNLKAKSIANQKGTSTSDKCLAIFQTMKDNFKFDFEDPFGYNDITKLMANKALISKTGQCYSLSLIFLMIAERMNVPAHLALSPNHSYIMFQDKRMNWVHIELTSGIVMSEAFVMQSGYVKSEALRSRIYMSPLPKKEVLGLLYTDLARYFGVKCRLSPFALKCVNRCLLINPNNIIGNLLKSDYLTTRCRYVLNQLGNPDKIYDPKAWKVYQEMTQMYDKVDSLGFEQIPIEIYNKWLEDMNNQLEKSRTLEMNLLND